MIALTTSELLRLGTLRSTGWYLLVLIGACVGPIVLLTLAYDPEYRGPIDASDLGKCASVFQMVAIVFAGGATAAEIRSGSVLCSSLTTRGRAGALSAFITVRLALLAAAYSLGMTLAITAAGLLYPDGLHFDGNGFAYLVVYLLVILTWSALAFALAELTRASVLPIAGPLIWLLLIEPLLSLLPVLAPAVLWMPAAAGLRLLGAVLSGAEMPAQAVVVLGALFASSIAASFWSRLHRDVTY